MAILRALWRLGAAVLQALRGALVCAFVFPWIAPEARMRHVAAWSARMLAALGVGLQVDGQVHAAPLLLASNHVSWLDILAINAVQPARFVSKHAVRRWPLLGWMVACGGTLFIERERKRDALRVVHQVADALRAGAVIAVFPEGTTGEGPALLPFHANLLQAAIATGAPVQAVALRFADAASRFSAAAAYGDISLARSVWCVVTAERLEVRVSLLAPQPTDGVDRRALAHELRRRIQHALDAPDPAPSARAALQPLP